METRNGNLYDYPKYYDLIFGSDWKAEFDFLEGVFERYCTGKVKRLFEPACGTGRLLMRFGKAGYEVAGNDLNDKAVAFCNKRLKRHSLPESAVVGDMCDFKPTFGGKAKKVDAMFNTINSFRHVPTGEAAEAHLRCVADGLRKGGVYVLGLHLTPPRGLPEADEESWAARRGNLSVLSHMWSMDLNRRRRVETIGMRFDVYTPSEQFRLANTVYFRTYTAPQMAELIKSVPSLEIAETFDFAYDLENPVKIDAHTEDVVYLLRKK